MNRPLKKATKIALEHWVSSISLPGADLLCVLGAELRGQHQPLSQLLASGGVCGWEALSGDQVAIIRVYGVLTKMATQESICLSVMRAGLYRPEATRAPLLTCGSSSPRRL